jgi:hypothetical protein
MTPADLFACLCERGVTLTPTADGAVRVKAPVGVLTPELVEDMRACKAALWVFARPAQSPVKAIPRTWVTGSVPPNGSALVGAPLPEATIHDTPTPPRTALGAPCTTKGCKPVATSPSGRPLSRYYRPTGQCSACYERLVAKERKQSTRGAARRRKKP